MKILGVSDGLDAGASLCIDDAWVAGEQQGDFDAVPRSRAFPWEAIDDVLRRAELVPGDIDTIAVAGRISPPFFLRRHPGIRKLVGGPFSPAYDVGVFYQAVLRQTGLAALEADRAAEWLAGRFEARGFRGRLYLVDIHTCLANATYRTQGDDDVLIITLHPLGDGVSFAVHRGALGQIDRVYEQKGFSTLHVHLLRCAEALGFDDVRSMWEGVGPSADPDLVADLSRLVHLDHAKLSHARYPLPADPAIYERLRRASPEVGAASVRANLSRAVCGLVRHHVRVHGVGRIAVAGQVFTDRRLVADLAELPEVESVWCPPDPGPGCVAMGAAAYAAGLPMRSRFPSVGDPAVSGRPDVRVLADALKSGKRVAMYTGRTGRLDPGDRCVLSVSGPGRRLALDLKEHRPQDYDALQSSLRVGSVYARDGLDRLGDRRSDTILIAPDVPVLAPLLQELAATDVLAVHATPLGAPLGDEAAVRRAARTAGADCVAYGASWHVLP